MGSRRPPTVRFVGDPNSRDGELDIRSVREHDFLLAHSRHQGELVPKSLFCIIGPEQLVEFPRLVPLGLFLYVARPVVLSRKARIPRASLSCCQIGFIYHYRAEGRRRTPANSLNCLQCPYSPSGTTKASPLIGTKADIGTYCYVELKVPILPSPTV
jgi:hypothetical protein